MVHKPIMTAGGLPVETDIVKTQEGLLETRVAGVLATTAGVDSLDISVVAHGNTVHLDGFVPDERQSSEARKIAASVDGVEHVVSHLAVGKTGTG